MSSFNGLGMHVGNLWRLSSAQTRSISAENFTGAKGQGGMATEGTGANCARELGQGWKVSPSMKHEPGTILTLAEIDGPGAIQHMWITGEAALWGPLGRYFILRIYWDGQDQPSVECPLSDFFCNPWGKYHQVNALPINVNPNRGFNSFFEMPFRKHCRVTLENRLTKAAMIYWQITYTLTDVPDDAAYFHAQFRRVNPLPYGQDYTILDGVRGAGQYVGTALAWGVNNNGWWGEGEIKFFMDGDGKFPTICGTGTEDYFCGAYNWDVEKQYTPYSAPYAGMMVHKADGLYQAQQRFALYRWHVMDPIRFAKDLRVTIQALGWRSESRYLPLQDDIASVAYWYQTLPTAAFPKLGDANALEIV